MLEGGSISVKEIRNYFQQYRCEILTADEKNRLLIQNFRANKFGNSLERYLKEMAWLEDTDGETKVYLVKDKNNEVALYFSLKCGLLYEPHDYYYLEPEKQEFVDMFIDAIEQGKQETIQDYFDAQMYSQEETEALYKIALERVDVKVEGEELGDDISALKVHNCFSAIELRHICKNINYNSGRKDIPLGVGLFWEVVVPQICKITDYVGCKFLYLFAADNTETKEEKSQTRKLVQYYKLDLKFEDIPSLMIIKPDYDRFCWGLVQKISSLKSNCAAIWEEFSDVY